MSRRRFMNENKLDFPKGLLHLWRLDGNLLDAVGGVNGSAEGVITYASGKFSTCAKLTNAANIIVNINRTLNKYTVQAWVKCISNIPYAPILCCRKTGDLIFFYDTYWASSGQDKGVYVCNAGGQIGWSYGNPLNWQLYTITCDGSNIKGHINGVQLPVLMTYQSVDKLFKFGSDTRIGRDTAISSRYLNGYIQQVMIFDRALSQSEINEYYNNGAGVEI